jgi:hypothetical protein
MGERRGAYRVMARETEGNKPLGTPRRTWENNIEKDLKEIGGAGVVH